MIGTREMGMIVRRIPDVSEPIVLQEQEPKEYTYHFSLDHALQLIEDLSRAVREEIKERANAKAST
jgi:hypothetical protein